MGFEGQLWIGEACLVIVGIGEARSLGKGSGWRVRWRYCDYRFVTT